MPIEYEDSGAGSVDISGTPDPVRTPKTLGDQQHKQQKQNERRPQADQNPLQKIGSAVGGAAKDAGEAAQGAGQWLQGQGFSTHLDSPNPVDWAKQYEEDASVPWGWARRGYKTLSGAYHDGVNGLFAGNDAWSKVGQTAAEFLASSIPLVEAGQTMADLGTNVEGLTGQIGDEQRQQQMQQHQKQAVQDLPGGTANTLMLAAPGSVAGRATQVAAPLLEQLLGGNPEDQNSALAWAAVGSVLSFGHLPEPIRKVLQSRFAGTEDFEKALTGAVDSKRQVSRNFQDPEKRAQQVADWITDQLSRGPMLADYGKRMAKAAKPGEPQRVQAEVTAEGAIKLLPSESRAAVQKLLKRVGVEDVDELVHKAQTEGITDPAHIKAIKEHWKELGQTYDLRRWHPGEMPLRDPRRHLDELADQQAGAQHISAINHYLDQVHRGLFANTSNPMQAILRALAGHARTTTLTHQQWLSSVVKLLGDKALTQEAQGKLMQAAEGDEDAYQALRPEEKMVVDGWGLMRAAGREASQGTDYAKNFTPDWVPRTDKAVGDMLRGRGRPSTASVLAREARLHREESIQAGPQGQLVLGPRFKNVGEANRALSQAREQLASTLTEGEHELSAELQNDPEARAIRALRETDPAAAAERARTLAVQKYPDKESNFLLNVNRVFANQVRAVHTHQALQAFTEMLARDGKAAAIKLRPGAARQREEFLRQGYRQLDDPRFQGFVFHPDLAQNLSRYVNHVGKGLRDQPGWKQALALEGKAVAAIMFSPIVHGLNVAGRMGMGLLMNPLEATAYLTKGMRHVPAHQLDDLGWSLRSEAYNAGLVPHYRGKSYADTLLSQMQDALADVEDKLPAATRSDSLKSRMASMWDGAARPHRWVNNHFWGKVNDFGVMMYHLEKAAAQRHGLQPEAAMEYAARRANSWMGSVAPEDTNPMVHDLSRLVLFAPNWWRTWAELMVPLYKRAGFTADPAYMKFAAYQSAKTISAALAFQKLTGNALNMLMSGHVQAQNQPGNQDRIEATAPWLDSLPGFSGIPAENPKTGARRTIENPLARQQLGTEAAAGFESGHPDYRPEDTWDGLAKFLVGRVSPLLNSVAALGNVDLYQSVADHQLRAVDPMEPAGSISPASLLAGAIYMTPVGQQFSQQVARSAGQGDVNPVESALGTKVPSSLQEAVKDVGDPVGRTAFSWITGTNAPYASSQRSRGIKPSDQDYQRAKQLTDDYHKQMTVLSAEAMSGQKTPSQWRQAYHDLSQQHAAQMEALFKNSPDYVNGGEGMAAQWEQLYQKATKPDGTLDQDQLAQFQAQFRSEHTADQLQGMDQLLRQNDSKFPMLALYHKSQQQFDQWQHEWAVQHNVDVNQLHKETGEYGALYGDNRSQQQYLRQHPELRAYETAKKRTFDRSQAGMIHALFYGNSATVNRALRARHMTAADLVSQESAA